MDVRIRDIATDYADSHADDEVCYKITHIILFTHVNDSHLISVIFKLGIRWPAAGMPGFLKLFLCGRWYVCFYVCPPQGY